MFLGTHQIREIRPRKIPKRIRDTGQELQIILNHYIAPTETIVYLCLIIIFNQSIIVFIQMRFIDWLNLIFQQKTGLLQLTCFNL